MNTELLFLENLLLYLGAKRTKLTRSNGISLLYNNVHINLFINTNRKCRVYSEGKYYSSVQLINKLLKDNADN